MAQLIGLWDWMTGKVKEEDAEVERAVRKLGQRAEGKQTLYVGLNQVEALQSLIDTRVLKEQKKGLRGRSAQQIRG